MQSYNAQKEDCNLLCGKQSLVDDVKNNMLADMTAPFGQYANDADSVESSRDYYSIYNRVDGMSSKKLRYQVPMNPSVYQNPDGTNSTFLFPGDPYKPVAQLSITDFNDNFSPSWAISLLPYHPEFYNTTN